MSSRYVDERGDVRGMMVVFDISLGLFVVTALLMYVLPLYGVWSQGLTGQAELQRATYNRQIAVNEAQAKHAAAAELAKAEVERAKGVAQANQIIGESLKNNEAYLRYLWIHALSDGKNEVIYVPTEANLPILEAGRFGKRQ